MVCGDSSTIWLSVFIIIGSIMILTIFGVANMFIQKHNKSVKSENISPLLGRSGFMCFIATTLVTLIIKIIRSVEVINIYCGETKQNIALFELSVVTHSLQYAFVLIIFFGRTNVIFKGTAFELSKNTIVLFYSMIILYIVMEPVTTILRLMNIETIRFIISGIQFVSLIICIIILTILFISKLIAIGKTQTDGIDYNLTKVITKTAILVFICIFISLPLPVMGVIGGKTKSIHVKCITIVYIFIDVYSNFLTVVLSIKHFDKIYLQLCGCINKLCLLCWNKVLRNDTAKLTKIIEMNSNSAISSTDRSVQSTVQ
eukprot:78418_1